MIINACGDNRLPGFAPVYAATRRAATYCSVSTSLVTRETRAPRCSVPWVSRDRSWMWRKARLRRVASDVSARRKQSPVHDDVAYRGAQQHRRGEARGAGDEGDVGGLGLDDAAVEDRLDRDRDHHLAGGGDDGEQSKTNGQASSTS